MEYNFDKFVEELQKIQVELSEKQLEQFRVYYEMLVEKNKVMNLTGITEWDEVLEKHFLDSISLIRAVNLNHNLTVMDMGTGAGFPGLPLKIAFPKEQEEKKEEPKQKLKMKRNDELVDSVTI